MTNIAQAEIIAKSDSTLADTTEHGLSDTSAAYGKFKSADELLKAYQALEGEFTRRSQQLSRLKSIEKSKRDNSCVDAKNNTSQNYITDNKKSEAIIAKDAECFLHLSSDTKATTEDGEIKDNCNITSDLTRSTIVDDDTYKKESKTVANEMTEQTFHAPLYDSDEWNSTVERFLKEKPEAEKYSHEIASLLLKDKTLASNSNCLMMAYGKVLENKIAENEKMLSEESIAERIMQNKKLKDMLIESYLTELTTTKSPANFKSGRIAVAPPKKPSTLVEANAQLFKIINKE